MGLLMSLEVLAERISHLLDRLEITCDKIDEIEKEVQSLQRWRAYLIGAWAVLATLGAILVKR